MGEDTEFIRLLFADLTLDKDDKTTLEDMDISDGSTIHVVYRTNGGGFITI